VRRLPVRPPALTVAGPLLLVCGLVLALLGSISPAVAQSGEDGGEVDAPVDYVAVIEVNGLLDPVMVDFIQESIGVA
jgi:hypothetical protein